MSTNLSAFVRLFGLALIALVVWLASSWGNSRLPAPLPLSAPAQQFAAGRAEGFLARILGPERPHPVGTAENAAVRARILKELAALHVTAHTYTAFTCNAWRGFSFIACATVTDIIADVSPGPGKALVMMAHYDSVPAGPGASDDQSGVATILEIIRALKSGDARSHHPVMALFTDGEEAGLLGAKAFLDNPQLKARVGAVVNMEARGTSGQTLLFQTSAGDAPLLDLYAREAPIPATSSLYGEIYKFLPNDTDLTPFLHDGFPALNYAFVGDVRYYHSPRDTRADLGPASLQMHGDDLLGTVRALDGSDLASLKSGNTIYISVLGLWLPRLPAALALPLAIASLLAIAFAAWIARPAKVTRGGMLLSAFLPLLLLLGCLATGFALAFIAQVISGSPDPTYAYPTAMRIALGFGVWGMTLVASRLAGVHGAATSAWLWIAGLAVITAVTLPGLSPYFLFPSIVAAVLLLSTARLGWSSAAGQIALLVSAIAALVIWLGLATGGEALMGLKLHPLFTVPAAFGLMTLVPLLAAHPPESRAWSRTAALCLMLAIAGGIVAGLLPSYSAASPQRVNLVYVENGSAPAQWIADTSWKGSASEPLPNALAKAAPFRFTRDAYGRLGLGSGYAAPAGVNRFPLPSASFVGDRKESAGRIVSFVLHGSSQTDVMALRIPAAARITAVRMRGQTLTAPRDWDRDTFLYCNGRDCRDLAVTLTTAAQRPFEIAFAERRYGLPTFGAALAAERPETAMPSQSGDGAVLVNTMDVLPKSTADVWCSLRRFPCVPSRFIAPVLNSCNAVGCSEHRWIMTFVRGLCTAALFTSAVALASAAAVLPARAWTYKVLYAFTGGSDGGSPGSLIRDETTGDLYGVASRGGDSCGYPGCGLVFRLTPDGERPTLYAFEGGENGVGPVSIVRDAAGNFYGVTSEGGHRDKSCGFRHLGCGVIFKLGLDGNFAVLHKFKGFDGAHPTGKLMLDAKTGDLYGATREGGADNAGVVFKLSADGTFQLLHSFNGSDGASPNGSLIQDSSGNLYGTTEEGGTDCGKGDGCGVVFKIAPDGTETVLGTFTGAKRGFPSSGLVADKSGNLYGTGSGFRGSHGSLFIIRPNGDEKFLYAFGQLRHNTQGSVPIGDLLLDRSRTIFGTTTRGGPNDGGVIYSLTTDGKYTVLYDLTVEDGLFPEGGLVQDEKGNLYGTAVTAGSGSSGTVFEVVK